MISPDLLGRFENTENGHYKFWTVTYNPTTNYYRCSWGRINYGEQGYKNDMDEKEANKKIKDKMKKGYVRVPSDLDVMHNQIFLLQNLSQTKANKKIKI